MNEKLNKIFDIASVVPSEIITKHNEVILPDTDKIEYDYSKTRNNLHTLLMTGQEALNAALEVAQASENPRAFEVVGNLMKQLAEVNQQLMDLHQQKQKLDLPVKKEQAASVTNNAIFVGSTQELSKLINNMNENGVN
jgi:hypothetical protein